MLSIRFTPRNRFGLLRIRLNGETLLLVTRGAVEASDVQARFFGVEPGAKIGWFLNVYFIKRRTIFFGRKRFERGRRFYWRSFAPRGVA